MVPLSESNCDTQRQLASATVGGKTYDYQYDADGIRTRKTNYDGSYTVNGDNISMTGKLESAKAYDGAMIVTGHLSSFAGSSDSITVYHL